MVSSLHGRAITCRRHAPPPSHPSSPHLSSAVCPYHLRQDGICDTTHHHPFPLPPFKTGWFLLPLADAALVTCLTNKRLMELPLAHVPFRSCRVAHTRLTAHLPLSPLRCGLTHPHTHMPHHAPRHTRALRTTTHTHPAPPAHALPHTNTTHTATPTRCYYRRCRHFCRAIFADVLSLYGIPDICPTAPHHRQNAIPHAAHMHTVCTPFLLHATVPTLPRLHLQRTQAAFSSCHAHLHLSCPYPGAADPVLHHHLPTTPQALSRGFLAAWADVLLRAWTRLLSCSPVPGRSVLARPTTRRLPFCACSDDVGPRLPTSAYHRFHARAPTMVLTYCFVDGAVEDAAGVRAPPLPFRRERATAVIRFGVILTMSLRAVPFSARSTCAVRLLRGALQPPNKQTRTERGLPAPPPTYLPPSSPPYTTHTGCGYRYTRNRFHPYRHYAHLYPAGAPAHYTVYHTVTGGMLVVQWTCGRTMALRGRYCLRAYRSMHPAAYPTYTACRVPPHNS